MSNKNNFRFFSGKGYYIALILCAAAIGITSYVYYRNADQPEQAAVRETWEDVAVGTETVQDIPVIATQPQTATGTAPAATGETAVTEPTRKKTLTTMSPVKGEAISGYSMEALSYNQTTRDWRGHNGIDLAAGDNEPVMAAADGEVYTVFEDDAMGHTVVIRHSDGYTTCYSSLSDRVAVKPGDRVTMGDTIGYAADSAIVESALGSHIHFSVTCYDEPMDPNGFLALGQ
jgi:murein DD-endopeptidase MepM/ murein hydrolase activator NlpD